MRKLTIEEKAQRYDEVIKAVKSKVKNDKHHILYEEDIIDIFPELKESEDEKIRKELISFVRGMLTCHDKPNAERDEKYASWIAWLEKQGEPICWKPSKEEMDVLYGLAYITNQYDEHKEEVITRLYQDLKREFFNGSSYENMFPNTEDSVRRRSTIQVLEYARSLNTYNQYGKADIDKNIAWLEKQGEPVEINPTEFDTRLQTLIGKFDSLPKEELIGSLSFWLNVVQNNGTYKPAKKQGKQKSAKNIVETWKDMRLEVYQQASGNRHESNCSDDTTKMFSLNDIDEIIEKMSEQKPVIEGTFVNVDEVREGFMQEVYRALYADPTNDRANQIIDAFDHLPTITIQKPVDKVEPKFKVGDFIVNDYCAGKVIALTDDAYLLDTGQGVPFSCEHNAHLWTIRDAKDGDVLAFYSEYRGNKMVQIGIIEKYVGKHGGCSNTFKIYVGVNWDNNLQIGEYMGCSDIRPATKEQRDTLIQAMANAGYTFDFEKKELKKVEQKSAWSEEDEKNSLDIKCLIGSYRTGDTENRLDSWIDSLKDRVQPKQEWSEEDEEERKRVVGLLKGWVSTFKETCYAKDCKCGIEWLKSLKGRYNWKPSEEQMKALNYVVNLMASSKSPNENDYYYNVFKNLRKQLKELMKG